MIITGALDRPTPIELLYVIGIMKDNCRKVIMDGREVKRALGKMDEGLNMASEPRRMWLVMDRLEKRERCYRSHISAQYNTVKRFLNILKDTDEQISRNGLSERVGMVNIVNRDSHTCIMFERRQLNIYIGMVKTIHRMLTSEIILEKFLSLHVLSIKKRLSEIA